MVSPCVGCRHMTERPAGKKGKKFFICTIGGPWGWAPKWVLDMVPEEVGTPWTGFKECERREEPVVCEIEMDDDVRERVIEPKRSTEVELPEDWDI